MTDLERRMLDALRETLEVFTGHHISPGEFARVMGKVRDIVEDAEFELEKKPRYRKK